MAINYTGGLNFTGPSKGDVDWDTVVDTSNTKISAHDHTGGGKGVQITGAALAANAVGGAALRLENDTFLRGRNAANSADVNLIKANTTDKIELGSVAVVIPTMSAPTTPPASRSEIYFDSTTKQLTTKDDAGFARSHITNFSTAAQTPAAATRTYLVGSNLSIPTNKMQIGTCFRWVFDMTKTAAGTAASTIDICVGTAGTTADTARVSFTKPAGTAAVDTALVTVQAICRGPLSASGVFAGTFQMTHNLAATGHAVIPCVNVTTVSGAFDVTTANLIVGLCITTGAADAITIQCVTAESWNL